MKVELPPEYPPPGRIVMAVTEDPDENGRELAACLETAKQLGLPIHVPRTVVIR